jgi:hypothetical protein
MRELELVRFAAGVAALLLGLTLLAPTARACTDDKECKGERICEGGVCMYPDEVQAREAPPAPSTASAASSRAFARIRAACTAAAIAHAGNTPLVSTHRAASSGRVFPGGTGRERHLTGR